MSFPFYVLSRFKYCLLLVKNSIANRNFPGWRAGAEEGHSLKHFLPWEENLEGCCLSNLYQAQQVIRCLRCKSAMVPIPQPCVVTTVGTSSKSQWVKGAQRCFFSTCWADTGTVNLTQNRKAPEKVHCRDDHHTFFKKVNFQFWRGIHDCGGGKKKAVRR